MNHQIIKKKPITDKKKIAQFEKKVQRGYGKPDFKVGDICPCGDCGKPLHLVELTADELFLIETGQAEIEFIRS